ncbi:gametocyte-specific factor 1 [Nelusetta ayraudi]|uniref:gametocyte-specific factor 1 n=1 Tax=Nelusetta ayraudi TaxID=303726 RepID=UPI003F6E568C
MATNFRFGSSCGPQATASAGRAQEEEKVVEQFDDTDNADPDKLLQCPYDKSHHIRSSRFPYHLIKCGKNHPKLAQELKICPYNARHRLPKHQFNAHLESCPNRRTIESEDRGDNSGYLTWQPPVSTWVNPDMTEDWDEEIEENAPLFILGVNSSVSGNQAPRPTNNFGSHYRSPTNLP